MAALLVFGLAAVFGLIITWTLRELAPRFGLLDSPDGRRKIHNRPIAVVGGVSLFLSALLAIIVSSLIDNEVARFTLETANRALWMLIGAAAIVFVGMVDDKRNLRARHKLLGQTAAAAALMFGGGYTIDAISFFGIHVDLGYLAIPFTFLWFLSIMNAVNLLDGMDGMLGSVGLIIFGSLALMATATGNGFAVVVAAAMAGGLAGFLRYNMPPASVYLGDCGSLLIGLVIAAVSIHASIKGPAFAVLVPVGLLVLPFMDTTAAILRRKLTGRGLAIADRGHLHHVLQKNGLTVRRTLAVVIGLGVLASVGAVSSTWMKNDILAIAMASGIVLMLVAAGLFGTAEVRLIRQRAWSMLHSSYSQMEMEVRLQGNADWADVWTQVTDKAEQLHLDSVLLDVNAPAWHEGYHRRWRRATAAGNELTCWRVELPLFGHGQVIGRLSVSGTRDVDCIGDTLRELATLVSHVEAVIAAVSAPAAQARAAATANIRPAIASIPVEQMDTIHDLAAVR